MNIFVDENHTKHDGAEVVLLGCGEKYSFEEGVGILIFHDCSYLQVLKKKVNKITISRNEMNTNRDMIRNVKRELECYTSMI